MTDIFKQTTYGREDRFSFLSVGNDILNKTTQEIPHKETAQMRVEVKHSNPTKTTALSIMAEKWRRVVATGICMISSGGTPLRVPKEEHVRLMVV